MTDIGFVIDGKYEILKEIGRGGMSIVYLAMDKRLNKQWAVKEIRKKGNGRNDEIIVNSLLAEANLMKRLDHPALPRIVDIIDNGVTIYIIMDYIEGESLDKILNEYGAQPEEVVIEWAKQLCDALGYLHSQKPPIIYRDMKPANVMLKPEGNIKIIDFGIAREYKEQSLADTTVLGTKGYAPPEQYSGQTDPRSDIYALGMTMHHLLTGVDPRNGDAYAPVRQWNAKISEGIEIIIDKCVQPAAENRYQSCDELLYDLDHPDLITKGYKKKQKTKLLTFILAVSLSILTAISGVVCSFTAANKKEDDYRNKMNDKKFAEAITLEPSKIEAYEELVKKYKSELSSKPESELEKGGSELKKKISELLGEIQGNLLTPQEDKSFTTDAPNKANVYCDAAVLYFRSYGERFKDAADDTKTYFENLCKMTIDYEMKPLAECYYNSCQVISVAMAPNTDDIVKPENLKQLIDQGSFNKCIEALGNNIKIDGDENDVNTAYHIVNLCYTEILTIYYSREHLAEYELIDAAVDFMNYVYQKMGKTADEKKSNKHINEFYERIKINFDEYINGLQSIKEEHDNKNPKGGNE